MPTDDTPNMPEPGTDSRVEDWLGQSVDRDAELADRLSAALPADEAEAAFERESSGQPEMRSALDAGDGAAGEPVGLGSSTP